LTQLVPSGSTKSVVEKIGNTRKVHSEGKRSKENVRSEQEVAGTEWG